MNNWFLLLPIKNYCRNLIKTYIFTSVTLGIIIVIYVDKGLIFFDICSLDIKKVDLTFLWISATHDDNLWFIQRCSQSTKACIWILVDWKIKILPVCIRIFYNHSFNARFVRNTKKHVKKLSKGAASMIPSIFSHWRCIAP